MSGESAQERTEPASEEKLRKARREGQVAKSGELTGALALTAAWMTMLSLAPELARAWVDQFRAACELSHRGDFAPATIMSFARVALIENGRLLWPALLAVVAVGVIVPLVQVRPLFTLQPLAPQLQRLDPVAGLRRMFFEPQGWMQFALSTCKLVLLGAVAWNAADGAWTALTRLQSESLLTAARLALELTRELSTNCLACLIGLGVADWLVQRHLFHKRQRMTKEEVRQEHKDDEGDPNYKYARRQMHEEIAQHAVIEFAREADVLVVNPTHIACALRYRPGENAAPKLVAKGEGALAARLRQVAKEHDIPIVRDISLARAIYRLELQSEIPEELYEAALEVLRWVEQVARAEGWTPAWRAENERISTEMAATDSQRAR